MKWEMYRCENCKKELEGEPPVTLKGVAAHEGILLPENLQSQHFCSVKCFWQWAEKNEP